MSTHYLGATANGVLVSRKSSRSDFTHAVVGPNFTGAYLPSFGTSREGALRNYGTNGRTSTPEIIELRIVDAAEYRAALKAARS